MKNYLFVIIIFLLNTCTAFGQTSDIVTFEQSMNAFPGNPQSAKYLPSRSKTLRLYSNKRADNIVITIDQAVTDLHPNAESIIIESVNRWREQLPSLNIDSIIRIDIKANGFDNTDRLYRISTSFRTIEGKRYSLALAQILFNVPVDPSTELIQIEVNSNSSLWYFKGEQSDITQSQYDFQTTLLRALAQLFGLKSTLQSGGTSIRIMSDEHNIYDYYIINTQNVLFSSFLRADRAGITNFVQGNNVYWKTPDSDIKIFAPTQFKSDFSLNFIEDENSFMHYDFQPNRKIWDIDNKVLQMMEDIGWKMLPKDITVSSSQIGSNGLASFYNSYTFTASSVQGTISEYYWEYRLKKTDGSYTVASSAATPIFTIQPAQIQPDYERNSDGDIVGQIYLMGKINNIPYESTINLYLECEPKDITFDVKIIPIDEWEYKVQIALQSPGATSFYINTVDWDSGFSSGKSFDAEHYMSTATSFNLSYDSPIYFTFKANNAYGSKTKNYQLTASYPDGIMRMKNSIADINITESNNQAQKYSLYTITGKLIKQVSQRAELFDNSIPTGTYIISEQDKKGNILTSKKIYIKQGNK